MIFFIAKIWETFNFNDFFYSKTYHFHMTQQNCMGKITYDFSMPSEVNQMAGDGYPRASYISNIATGATCIEITKINEAENVS